MIDFSVWPPTPRDGARIKQYIENEALWKGDFDTAFPTKPSETPEEPEEKIDADWPALITKVSSDMLFGETPIVSADADQEQVDALLEQLQFWQTCAEGAISQSFSGDCFLRLYWDARRRTVALQEIPARNYFAEIAPDNAREILSEAVAFVVEVGEKCFLRVDHYLPSARIWRKAYTFDVYNPDSFLTSRLKLKEVLLAEVYGDLAPPEFEDTGLGSQSPIFHIPNQRYAGQFWGVSDYSAPLKTEFAAFNDRLSDIDGTLSDHARPKMLMPQGVLDEDGKVNRRNLDVIEVPPEYGGQDAFKYLTWDGQLFPGFKQLEVLADLIYKFSETSPAIFGEDKAGSIESGRAMKFRFQRTLAKISRKKTHWGPVLKRLIHFAQLLAAKRQQVIKLDDSTVIEIKAPTSRISIQWQDGLPQDPREAAEVESLRVQNGLASKVSAIQRLDQVSQSVAAEEWAKIQEENSGQTTSGNASGGTPDVSSNPAKPVGSGGVSTGNPGQTSLQPG